MYNLFLSNKFKKDTKRIQKRGFDMEVLKTAINELEITGKLSKYYKPHKLSGKYSGFWEAHLKPDWLIIWKVYTDEKEIWLTRTGTHSDLFK